MPSVNSFSQYLPHLLWIFSILILVTLALMNLRTRWARRRLTTERPREFIDRVRADAVRQAPEASRRAAMIEPHRNKSGESEESGVMPAEAVERRLESELETKQAVLRTLIRQADERIAMLNGLLDRLPAASISPRRLGSQAMTSTVTRHDHDRAHRDDSAAAIPIIPDRPLSDPLTSSIYELADRGRSPIEIARELNEQVGKVQLILALRQPA